MTTATLFIYVALFGIALAAGETEKNENDRLFHAGLPAAHAIFVHRPISEVESQSFVQPGSHPHGEVTGINIPVVPINKPVPASHNDVMHAGLPSAHTNFVHRPASLVEQEHQDSLLAKNIGPSSLDLPVPPSPPEPIAEAIHFGMTTKEAQGSAQYGPLPVPVPVRPNGHFLNLHQASAEGAAVAPGDNAIHTMPIMPGFAPQAISAGLTEEQLRALAVQPVRDGNGNGPRSPFAPDLSDGATPPMLPPRLNDAALLHHGAIASSADILNAHHMLPEEARAFMMAHPLPSRPDASSSSSGDSMSMLPPGAEAWTRNGIPINRHDLQNPFRPAPEGVAAAAASGPVRHFLPFEQNRSLVDFGRGFVPYADRSHLAPPPPPLPPRPSSNSNSMLMQSVPSIGNLPDEIPPPPPPFHQPPSLPHTSEEMRNHLPTVHNMMGGLPAFPEDHFAHGPDSAADFSASPPAHFQAAFGRGKTPEDIPMPMLPHNIPSNMDPHQMTPAFDTFLRGFLRGSMPNKVAVIPATATATTEEERMLSANPPPEVTAAKAN